jgi:bifunctional UDP-N-acetylglucosamine pyrophosphorylase/glucosamine-1-phosphate N-acetyltransferase
MSKYSVQAIILAAGKSKRFNTGNSKLLEKLCGQELILYPARLLETINIPSTFVLNYQADEIKKVLQATSIKASFVLQPEPKGTGDALAHTQKTWHQNNILVMNGDMPLVTEEIIIQLIEKHLQTNATVSFVTAHHPNPSITDYGRVIAQDNTFRIIEAKDLQEQHESCCINAGIYLFKREFLLEHITTLTNHNAAQEFYITDLIKIASDKKLTIETISAPFDHIRGVNTLKEFWTAEQIKRSELISLWMERGVRFDVAQSVHLDMNIVIGAGTRIGAGVHILQGTTIGNNCTIEPFSIIKNSTLGNDCHVFSHSIISDSFIEQECKVGPFAHIKDKSYLKHNAVIGNFVEVCRTTIGTQSKAKHLSYLGDTEIGKKVNIGAGTITCNYDGKIKHTTIIEDEVFIGSNNTLVAPITIEKKSYTAAGSTITNDVPTESLALGRARQVNKEGYAKKFTKKEDKANPEKKNKHKDSGFFGAIKTHNDLLEQ